MMRRNDYYCYYYIIDIGNAWYNYYVLLLVIPLGKLT